MKKLLSITILALLMAACGQTGKLYLPEKPKQVNKI